MKGLGRAPSSVPSGVGQIKINPLLLLALIFGVLSPFVVYREISDATELYLHGERTVGTVIDGTQAKTLKFNKGPGQSYTVNASVYQANYLETYSKSFRVPEGVSGPTQGEQVQILYSAPNPRLAIVDPGTDRSFIGLLEAVSTSIWMVISFSVVALMCWMIVIISARKFLKDLNEVRRSEVL